MRAFWDRETECAKLKSFLGKAGFGYIPGRRRVGKTALLAKVCKDFEGLYHQAVEGTPQQQIEHLVLEWRDSLPLLRDFAPKTWHEVFSLLTREKLPRLLVFDEFPYWVQGDPSLPSLLQKWIDHELPKKKTFLCVSGSSQSMLYAQFLNQTSPLYGRSLVHLHLEPLSFLWFCRAMNYSPRNPVSFERFSLVGGIPHYWKLMPRGSFLNQVETLYFEPSAILAEEPKLLIQEEGITGTLPKAILDLVGRGVSKPSEIAARLGAVQGNLSRPLSLLQELKLLQRELPFGESSRTTKKVLYSIPDPVLSFYYRIYLPFRGHWASMTRFEKGRTLNLHVSRQWEIFCRSAYPGSGRYWEGDIEIDLVSHQPEKRKTLVAECKWADLTQNEERGLMEGLSRRFSKTRLAKKFTNPEFTILSKKDLFSLSSAD